MGAPIMIADKLLSRLEGVKQGKGNSWIALCSAHDDKSPSLTVTEIEDRVLIKCWSGCSAYEICQSVGLEITDLFPERIPATGNKPIPKEKRFNANHVLKALLLEITVIDLFGDLISDPENDIEVIIKSLPRVRESFVRIKAARQLITRMAIS